MIVVSGETSLSDAEVLVDLIKAFGLDQELIDLAAQRELPPEYLVVLGRLMPTEFGRFVD